MLKTQKRFIQVPDALIFLLLFLSRKKVEGNCLVIPHHIRLQP